MIFCFFYFFVKSIENNYYRKFMVKENRNICESICYNYCRNFLHILFLRKDHQKFRHRNFCKCHSLKINILEIIVELMNIVKFILFLRYSVA